MLNSIFHRPSVVAAVKIPPMIRILLSPHYHYFCVAAGWCLGKVMSIDSYHLRWCVGWSLSRTQCGFVTYAFEGRGETDNQKPSLSSLLFALLKS